MGNDLKKGSSRSLPTATTAATDPTSGECHLWDLVHDVGGPVGVADNVLELQNRKQHQRPFIVLLAGNSFLRQVFEAISCGWFNDVTDYRANTGAKTCDSKACRKQMLKERGELKYFPDEVGNVPSLLERVETSCYMNDTCMPTESPAEKTAFYRPGVTVPTNIFDESVSDNIAMVEFGGKIRFYFMFHPEKYFNVTGLFKESLGLDLDDVDKLIWNGIAAPDPKMKQIFKSNGVWQTRSIWQHKGFKRIQERDIGRWFGADNPWIYHVPDIHACLPGPPDDGVNLILYLILSNAFVRRP